MIISTVTLSGVPAAKIAVQARFFTGTESKSMRPDFFGSGKYRLPDVVKRLIEG